MIVDFGFGVCSKAIECATDVTDFRLLAEQLEWAALNPAAHGHAFNTANGDVFRWRWLWPQMSPDTRG